MTDTSIAGVFFDSPSDGVPLRIAASYYGNEELIDANGGNVLARYRQLVARARLREGTEGSLDRGDRRELGGYERLFQEELILNLYTGRLTAKAFRAGSLQAEDVPPHWWSNVNLGLIEENAAEANGSRLHGIRVFGPLPIAGGRSIVGDTPAAQSLDVAARDGPLPGDILTDAQVRALAGTGSDAPPPAAVRWFWNLAAERMPKFNVDVRRCKEATACTWRQALEAGRTLPSTHRHPPRKPSKSTA